MLSGVECSARMAGLVPVSVGRARESYGEKYNVVVGEWSAGGQGWHHQITFQVGSPIFTIESNLVNFVKAHGVQSPGTVPLCVGNTGSDWRHIVKWGVNASGNGWNHIATVCITRPIIGRSLRIVFSQFCI